jgi:hypothetical protein
MNFWDWIFPYSNGSKEVERFTELRAKPILSTIDKLSLRIAERFPESGLSKVCKEFYNLAVRSELLVRHLAFPIWPVRIFAILAVMLLLGLVAFAFYQLAANFHFNANGMSDLLQSTEAAVNELIFLGLALFFLVGLESRIKRRTALKALHHLRSIAHIVDMHQLTKDPTHQLVHISDTESSPKRVLTRAELTRYLDYCSELLALIAKIGALFAQNVDDPVVLNAVNDLEVLTQGLSAKIWQKIMILDLADA